MIYGNSGRCDGISATRAAAGRRPLLSFCERANGKSAARCSRSLNLHLHRPSLSLSSFYCSLRSLRRNLHYFPTQVGCCAGYTIAAVCFISALKSWIECSLKKRSLKERFVSFVRFRQINWEKEISFALKILPCLCFGMFSM